MAGTDYNGWYSIPDDYFSNEIDSVWNFNQDGIIKRLNQHMGNLYGIPVYQTKKQSIMKKLSNNLKRMLSPNHQALYKAGYLNGNLDITEDGRIALTELLLEKYELDMVEKAKERIAELEKEDK